MDVVVKAGEVSLNETIASMADLNKDHHFTYQPTQDNSQHCSHSPRHACFNVFGTEANSKKHVVLSELGIRGRRLPGMGPPVGVPVPLPYSNARLGRHAASSLMTGLEIQRDGERHDHLL